MDEMPTQLAASSRPGLQVTLGQSTGSTTSNRLALPTTRVGQAGAFHAAFSYLAGANAVEKAGAI